MPHFWIRIAGVVGLCLLLASCYPSRTDSALNISAPARPLPLLYRPTPTPIPGAPGAPSAADPDVFPGEPGTPSARFGGAE